MDRNNIPQIEEAFEFPFILTFNKVVVYTEKTCPPKDERSPNFIKQLAINCCLFGLSKDNVIKAADRRYMGSEEIAGQINESVEDAYRENRHVFGSEVGTLLKIIYKHSI